MPNIYDLIYTAALVEFIARDSKTHRSAIAEAIGIGGLSHILEYGPENRSLTLQQVCDEIREDHEIPDGAVEHNCSRRVAAIGEEIAQELAGSVSPEQYAEALYRLLTE